MRCLQRVSRRRRKWEFNFLAASGWRNESRDRSNVSFGRVSFFRILFFLLIYSPFCIMSHPNVCDTVQLNRVVAKVCRLWYGKAMIYDDYASHVLWLSCKQRFKAAALSKCHNLSDELWNARNYYRYRKNAE